jgi:hypothetical protein
MFYRNTCTDAFNVADYSALSGGHSAYSGGPDRSGTEADTTTYCLPFENEDEQQRILIYDEGNGEGICSINVADYIALSGGHSVYSGGPDRSGTEADTTTYCLPFENEDEQQRILIYDEGNGEGICSINAADYNHLSGGHSVYSGGPDRTTTRLAMNAVYDLAPTGNARFSIPVDNEDKAQQILDSDHWVGNGEEMCSNIEV